MDLLSLSFDSLFSDVSVFKGINLADNLKNSSDLSHSHAHSLIKVLYMESTEYAREEKDTEDKK